MSIILDDINKFHKSGDSSCNETLKTKSLLKRFIEFHKINFFPKTVNVRIHNVGSQRPCIYDLSKIHQLNTHHRPILSVFDIAQH